jgi:phage/plasmid-like protein (TIGR03299 family)
MSHDIQKNDTAVYNEHGAWHGLGDVVVGLTVQTIRERYPSFAFPLVTAPIVACLPDGSQRSMEQVAVLAADTMKPLGVVSEGYRPFDNGEMLDIVAECSAFGEETTLESVLTLRGRRVAVILAHLGQFVLPGDDKIERYLLWSTAHDGTRSLDVRASSVRVVCNNTLTMALSERGRMGFQVSHRAGMQAAVRAGVTSMQQAVSQAAATEEACRSLADTELSQKEVQEFFLAAQERLYRKVPPADSTDAGDQSARTRAEKRVGEWVATLEAEEERYGVTAWTALNAVTNWVDHTRSVRVSKAIPESKRDAARAEARAYSNLLGTGSAMKAQVLDLALELVP